MSDSDSDRKTNKNTSPPNVQTLLKKIKFEDDQIAAPSKRPSQSTECILLDTQSTDLNQSEDRKKALKKERQRRYREKNREEINRRKSEMRQLKKNETSKIHKANLNRRYREKNREEINRRRREMRQLRNKYETIGAVPDDEISRSQIHKANLQKESDQRYRDRNRERINQRNRELRQKERSLALQKERQQRYRERHKEKINKRIRELRQRKSKALSHDKKSANSSSQTILFVHTIERYNEGCPWVPQVANAVSPLSDKESRTSDGNATPTSSEFMTPQPFEVVFLVDDFTEGEESSVEDKIGDSSARNSDSVLPNQQQNPQKTKDSSETMPILRVRSTAELQQMNIHLCAVCGQSFDTIPAFEQHSKTHEAGAKPKRATSQMVAPIIRSSPGNVSSPRIPQLQQQFQRLPNRQVSPNHIGLNKRINPR